MTDKVDLTLFKVNTPVTSGMPEASTCPIKKDEVSIGQALSAKDNEPTTLSLSKKEDTTIDPKLAEYGISLDKPFTVTKEMIQKMKAKGKKGFWESLKDNAKNAIPFISGAMEIKKAIDLMAIAKKQEAGEKLTKEETEKLYLYLLEQLENEHRDSTFMGKVGEMMSHLPAFAGEFAVTGGLYSAGNKVALKASEKLLGHIVKKQLGKTFIQKASAVAVGSAFRTVALSNTYAGIMHRRTELDTSNMQEETLEDGTKVTTGELGIKKSDESFGTSVAKGLADGYIEALSEQSGQALIAPMSKIPVFGKFLVPAKGSQKFLSKLGYHGLLEEYAEERFGGFLRGAIGLDKLQDKGYIENLYDSTIPSWEQSGVELTTTALWGGALTGSHKVFNKTGLKLKELAIKEYKLEQEEERKKNATITMLNGAKVKFDGNLCSFPTAPKQTLKLLSITILGKLSKLRYISKFKKGTYYKPVIFKECTTVEEAKNFAKKNLHMNISIENSADALKQANWILKTITDIYTKSKGKIKLPLSVQVSDKILTKIKLEKNIIAGAVSNVIIYFPATDPVGLSKEETLFHELGHINHAFRINSLRDLGTRDEITKHTAITSEFWKNEDLQIKIYNEVSHYATESPAEFVAEMYAGLMMGKHYSPELMERYNMYKGPTNWRFYCPAKTTQSEIKTDTTVSTIREEILKELKELKKTNGEERFQDYEIAELSRLPEDALQRIPLLSDTLNLYEIERIALLSDEDFKKFSDIYFSGVYPQEIKNELKNYFLKNNTKNINSLKQFYLENKEKIDIICKSKLFGFNFNVKEFLLSIKKLSIQEVEQTCSEISALESKLQKEYAEKPNMPYPYPLVIMRANNPASYNYIINNQDVQMTAELLHKFYDIVSQGCYDTFKTLTIPQIRLMCVSGDYIERNEDVMAYVENSWSFLENQEAVERLSKLISQYKINEDFTAYRIESDTKIFNSIALDSNMASKTKELILLHLKEQENYYSSILNKPQLTLADAMIMAKDGDSLFREQILKMITSAKVFDNRFKSLTFSPDFTLARWGGGNKIKHNMTIKKGLEGIYPNNGNSGEFILNNTPKTITFQNVQYDEVNDRFIVDSTIENSN